MIRTILVDDEPEARKGLRTLLDGVDTIEIVDDCINGIEAIEAIEKLKPDLVFLDIQMPKVNGFEVLNSINYKIPYVIFVTAYDKYAVKAFEINAQDYLLKPFSDERFYSVLELAQKSIEENKNQSEVINNLVSSFLSSQKQELEGEQLDTLPDWNKLTIKNRNKITFVEFKDIHWIEGYDYCVKIHTLKETHVVRATLKEMEGKLKSHFFYRVSRSALVNMNKVKEIKPYSKSELLIVTYSNTEIKISRSYKSNLSKFL